MTFRLPSLVVATWLGLMALCIGSIVTNLQIRTDLSVFLPDARTPAHELLVDQLRESPTTQMVIAALEGDDARQLAQASIAFGERLRTNREIVSVVNGPTSLNEREREFLFQNRYLLMPSRQTIGFEAAHLRAMLESALERLTGSFGMVERRFIALDPSGEWQRLLGDGEAGDSVSLRQGVWFSSSGERALLLIRTRAPAFDLDAQARALGEIRHAFAASAPESVRLTLTGPGVFAVASRHAIKADAWRLSLLGNTAVVGLLFCVFRSLRPVLLTVLPVASGVLAGTATVMLAYGYIHGITLAFGVTLTGIAIDYPLHVLFQRSANEATKRAVDRIWPTLRLGIVTTVIAYSMLLLADIRGLVQLGLLSAVGVLVAGAVTRWVLPALAGASAVGTLPADSRLYFPTLTRPGLRALVVALVIVSGLYLVWRAPAFWQHDLAELSPVPRHAKETDRALRAELGAADLRHVILAVGDTAQEALERCEAVIVLLETGVKEEMLGGYDSPCHYLPSIATQRARQSQIPDADVLRSRLHQASKGLPFRAGLFEPFVSDLARTRSLPLLAPEDLHGTLLGARLETLLFRQGPRWVAILPVRKVEDPTALTDLLKADDQHVYFLDLKRESEKMVAGYRDSALILWGFGLMGIIAVLWIGLGSIQRVLRLSLPVAGAIVLVCALLLLTGHRISLFHLVALLLVLGLGLDYLLFFNRRHVDASERQRSARAVLLCSATTVLVFGVLALSQVPVLSAIGSTVALGSIVCFMFAAIFSPPALSLDAEALGQRSVV